MLSRMVFVVCTLLPPLLAAQSQPNVAIFMQFDGTPGAASVVNAMESEVAHLFKPAGLAFTWRFTNDKRAGDSFNHLAVVRFKGRCTADEFGLDASSEFNGGELHTLGETKVANGRILPYTEVRCDEVRKALAFLGPGAGITERQLALGRALGRVLAHELYHIFANAKTHASKGLAHAIEPLDDLVSPKSAGFQDADWKAFAQNFGEH